MKFKYVFVAFVLLIISFVPKTYALDTNNLVKYNGKIEHLFTHCLIAYPSLAFDNNNFMKRHYDEDCLTVDEFNKILLSLYNNNYVLINMTDTYEIKDGKAIKKDLYLPKGKKPLILSFDDVNYDTKKIGRGMVDKIILDEDGNLATYTNNPPDGIKISHNKEFISVLNNFINKYPSFSFNGAKGLICLTGYDGILGYRTDLVGINRVKEIEAVKPVIKALKDNGWQFASHSYGHYHMNRISDAKFEVEINRFKDEVNSLIGETEIYVYPYGEYEISNNKGKKTKKHLMLEDAGFKVFLGVGKRHFFGYAPFNMDKKERVLFMDRKPIDGNNLRKNHNEYKKFFDSKEVYDNGSRKIKFY